MIDLDLIPLLKYKKDTSQNNRTIYGFAYAGATDTSKSWLIFAVDSGSTLEEKIFAKVEGVENDDYCLVWEDRLSYFVDPVAAENSKSVVLDGIDNYLDGGGIYNFDISTAFTFSVWLKPQNTAANRIILSKAGPGPAVDGYMLRHNTGGALFLQMRSGTNRSHTFTGVTLAAGVWQHLVFSFTGSGNISGARVYIDKVVGSTPPSGTLSGTMLVGQDFYLGQRNGTFYYSGGMDDFTVWSKALSQAEVDELYDSVDPNTHSAAGNLLAWNRMGEGDTGLIANDSVDSNDLQLVNMSVDDFVEDIR